MDPETIQQLQAILATAISYRTQGRPERLLDRDILQATGGIVPSFRALVGVLQQNPSTPPTVSSGDVALSLGQGATMGGLGKVAGLLANAALPGSGSAVRENIESRSAGFREQHPGVALGTEMLGGAVPGILTGGLMGSGTFARAVPSVASRGPIVRGMAAGALTGAASGALGATSIDDVLENTGTGMVTGAAAGGLLGAGGEMVRRGAVPLVGAAARFAAGKISPEAGAYMEGLRQLRSGGQREAAVQMLRRALGWRPADVVRQETKALVNQVRAQVYGPLDQQYATLPMDAELQGFLRRPQISTIWRSVSRELPPTGQRPAQGPGMPQLQLLREELIDRANQLARTGAGGRARRIGDLVDELNTLLEARVPGMSAANAAYRQVMTVQRAQALGSTIFKRRLSAEEVAAELRSLVSAAGPHAERAAATYRDGFIAEASKRMLVSRSPENVERLAALAGAVLPEEGAQLVQGWSRGALPLFRGTPSTAAAVVGPWPNRTGAVLGGSAGAQMNRLDEWLMAAQDATRQLRADAPRGLLPDTTDQY